MADRESRSMNDWSNWMLDVKILKGINQLFNPLKVDLFASRLTHQCQCYFIWQPDPLAEATDAFLQNWAGIRGYANPPWNLIANVPANSQAHEALIVLIAPVWKAQPWYPCLLAILVDLPCLLPHQVGVVAHLDPQLAIWSISERDSGTSNFHHRLRSSSSSYEGQRWTSLTTHSLGDGIAGVLNGVQMAIMCPSRSVDLSSMDILRMQSCSNEVSFLLSSLANQSRQGKSMESFFFPSFLPNK